MGARQESDWKDFSNRMGVCGILSMYAETSIGETELLSALNFADIGEESGRTLVRCTGVRQLKGLSVSLYVLLCVHDDELDLTRNLKG
jgi:hypothetical protein